MVVTSNARETYKTRYDVAQSRIIYRDPQQTQGQEAASRRVQSTELENRVEASDPVERRIDIAA